MKHRYLLLALSSLLLGPLVSAASDPTQPNGFPASKETSETQSDKKAEEFSPEVSRLIRIKDRAVVCGDYATGIAALHGLIEVDSATRQGRWRYELAHAYLSQGNLRGGQLVAEDVFKYFPEEANTIGGKVLKATIQEMAGHAAEATQTWEEIVAMPGAKPIYSIRLVNALVESGELDAAQIEIKTLMEKKAGFGEKVIVAGDEQSGSQEVPVEAALLNMNAIVALKKSPADVKTARESLKKALSIHPDYIAAKANDASAEKLEKELQK